MGRLVSCAAKNAFRREDLKTGDEVTIEARQELVQYLVAVTITAQGTAKN